MHANNKPTARLKSDSGAALLTVLMLSTLLLAAGGTLLLVSTMNTTTAIDETAELQAYYAAEAGLQSTLNVLRGNVAPNSAMPSGTQISFRKAIELSSSNLPTDISTVARLSGWLNYNYKPAAAPVPDRVGLTSGYAPGNGVAFSVVLTDPDHIPVSNGEPARLRLQVMGFGPKGAIKKLELVVKRTNFDYTPQATIMMRSADDGSPMTFDLGESAAKSYSGHDHSGSTTVVSAFGSTTTSDMTLQIGAANKNTVADPIASTVDAGNLPAWLKSANQARAFLNAQKANAISQGRYFSSFDGTAGTSSSPAFTFVNGDCVLRGGAGLLIVTGNLEMNGNPDFDGLIFVLGGGSINRNGGGNGNIYGAITVARFDRNGTGTFLAPEFHTNGGGNATIQYDSSAVRKALNLSGPLAEGVREY